MKFDFVIGNPPYQSDRGEGEQKNFSAPVYHHFLDEAYKVADKVEMIHPARFLFNAGNTPKTWNEKMLHDKHFKVNFYEEDSHKVFTNTEIKGGVVVSYHDNDKDFGEIDIFTPYMQMNDILKKVRNSADFLSFGDIVISRTAYRLTDKLHEEHPEALSQLSKGHAYDMSTNIFERLPQVFFAEKPEDSYTYIRILGRLNNTRIYKYIRKDYVNDVKNLDFYKVLLPKACGRGTFGETITGVIIEPPQTGSTETFVSIGMFQNKDEAQHVLKYIKTKFARALLGVLKKTQDITPDKFKFVPLQDFTSDSDINWTQSIHEIDEQLYKKYHLSGEEIAFIEKNVKEME